MHAMYARRLRQHRNNPCRAEDIAQVDLEKDHAGIHWVVCDLIFFIFHSSLFKSLNISSVN